MTTPVPPDSSQPISPAGPAGAPGDPSSFKATEGEETTKSSDPWIRYVEDHFNVPPDQAEVFAQKFKSNMIQMLNQQITRDKAQSKKAAQEFKESIG